jgi:nucleoside-diphosphate-sugar epimerase
VERLLIVGCGDIARRALPNLSRRYRVIALLRSSSPAFVASGIELIESDLDDPVSLAPLAGCAQRVAHLAPPNETGALDLRTRSLLAVLSTPGAVLPRRFVYVSTSGVYGDCKGDFVDETRPPNPQTERAKRRLDAEQAISKWGETNRVETVVLRVPGIYAADRLPLERIAKGTPVLREEDDVYINHVHADDLAAILVAALESPSARGAYNACDDGAMKMGDWFDLVADRAGLARPPRVARAEAARVLPAALLSFMGESRRLVNRRMKAELGVRLRYPTVADGVPRIQETA